MGRVATVEEMANYDPHRDYDYEQEQVPALSFVSALRFIKDHAELAEPIVDGMFRRGETVNVIGSTKMGKSWLILGLALSIADGRPWLGRPTKQGRVALIDNELQPATLSGRIKRVASAMMVEDDILHQNLAILPLRGNLAGLAELREPLEELGEITMVAMDAFYRFIPRGVSENDNSAMTQLYNTVDQLAGLLDAAFVLNHHSSKGSQSEKRTTDVGSGAGSISRAADTHLIIREHKDPDLAVLDAACRSFAPVDSESIKFEFPLWDRVSDAPELKRQKPSGVDKQEALNREADEAVRKVLGEAIEPMSRNRLAEKCGMGPGRVNASLFRLSDEILETQRQNPKNKNATIDVFEFKPRGNES